MYVMISEKHFAIVEFDFHFWFFVTRSELKT